jgi:carbamoyltransferase
MEHAYWGPEFSNEQIEKVLKEKGAKYEKHDDISGVTAELIHQQKIIGWFQGRMEVGPRALGNRSVIADPTNPKMKDIINQKVKDRETWRPFAPSVLEKSAAEYFEGCKKAPFMIVAFDVAEKKRKEIPAVVHVDGTARPQTVTKETNPRYFKLIQEFEKLSGTPVVLNTSFNEKEPIVCTPQDAYNTFLKTGIDCLVLGNYLVRK